MADKKITYKNSGVNIDEGNLFVKKIQPFVKSTSTKNILYGTSSFAALYKLDINKIKNPVCYLSGIERTLQPHLIRQVRFQ